MPMKVQVQVKMKISIVAICVVEGSEQDPVEGRGWACEMNVYGLYVICVCKSKMRVVVLC
eukprot:scaffold16580_cov147-Skeletonema_marinoi.AAC.13